MADTFTAATSIRPGRPRPSAVEDVGPPRLVDVVLEGSGRRRAARRAARGPGPGRCRPRRRPPPSPTSCRCRCRPSRRRPPHPYLTRRVSLCSARRHGPGGTTWTSSSGRSSGAGTSRSSGSRSCGGRRATSGGGAPASTPSRRRGRLAAENGSVHLGVPYTTYTFNEPPRRRDLRRDVPLMVPLSYTFMSYFAFSAGRLIASGPFRTRAPRSGTSCSWPGCSPCGPSGCSTPSAGSGDASTWATCSATTAPASGSACRSGPRSASPPRPGS